MSTEALQNSGNWTIESTNTTGTGALNLTGSDVGFARFKDSIPPGEIYYAIQDGTTKEAGIGIFNGTDTILRSDVKATLQGGVYNDQSPPPINLTGNAIVALTINASAFDFLSYKEHGLGTPSSNGMILASNTDGTRFWLNNSLGITDHQDLQGRNLVDQHTIQSITGLDGILLAKEDDLGSPITTGYVLQSDTLGNRSWVAQTSAGTNDHALLLNRDITDQHTIPSITNLQSNLDAKELNLGTPSTDDYILSSKIDGTREWVPNASAGAGDHNLLTNRDIANQHIIGAISGLQDELDAKSLIGHDHSGIYEPASIEIQAHIANTSNPHSTTSTHIGLGDVDNTRDIDKPVSTAQQTAIDLKEDYLLVPDTDGLLLSSLIDGTRSWVSPTAGGGLPDAPVDGNVYGRKNANWTAVTSGTFDHSLLNNRLTNDQHNIASITNLQTELDTKITDATADGFIYARQNNTWTTVTSGTFDHNDLLNRNDPNQHNIASILSLQDTLDTKLSSSSIILSGTY